MIRVTLLPADRGGCGLHRMFNPARALLITEPGKYDISIGDGIQAFFDRRGEVTSLPPMNCDLLVLQRTLDAQMVKLIPHIQRQGVAVVVEVDDDIERVATGNFAWWVLNHPQSKEHYSNLHAACEQADLVTVSTPALARYASHGRVVVLPNFVPYELATMPRHPNPTDTWRVKLGWSGTMETHPLDPYAPRGQVGRVVAETGCQFWQIGNPVGVHHAIGLPRLAKLHTSGWVPLPQYPQALSQLDVGIVPLEDSQFNRAKSGLKGLEMAALGIPFVASDTPDYRRLADFGVGTLAAKPKTWYRETRRLVVDHAYRQQMSDEGRAAVLQYATIEANAYRWAEAWEQALSNRRSRAQLATI